MTKWQVIFHSMHWKCSFVWLKSLCIISHHVLDKRLQNDTFQTASVWTSNEEKSTFFWLTTNTDSFICLVTISPPPSAQIASGFTKNSSSRYYSRRAKSCTIFMGFLLIEHNANKNVWVIKKQPPVVHLKPPYNDDVLCLKVIKQTN